MCCHTAHISEFKHKYSWCSFKEWGMGICSLELSFWALRFRWIQMQVMAKEWVDWGLLMSGTGIHCRGRDNNQSDGTANNYIRYGKTCEAKIFSTKILKQKRQKLFLADVHLFFWIKQVKKLHDRQEVSQGILLYASWYELQQDPHEVVSPFNKTSTCKLKRKTNSTAKLYELIIHLL